MTIKIVITLIALSFWGSFLAQANEHSKLSFDQAIVYSIHPKVIALLTLSAESPDKAEVKVAKAIASFNHANIGEQYLILLSKAHVAQYQQQHQQVITLLEQAQVLSEKIATKQLSSPLFANLYQVLAASLAAMNNYEEAYQVKKSFVDGYNDYSDAQRDETVKQLTKKYEITHKIESNKLLDNQNKLKAIRLNDVEKKQEIQQRNITLIFCTILVFILLFLRQLKVRKRLLSLTKTDNLTGLTNRAVLFVKGEELIKTSQEQQLELSVLLFDIDHFKRINENYGHPVGDLVLIKIAELVNETMRSRDIFARLGGEEFAAILPNTDIDKAKAIAVRVMEKVAQYDFSKLGINSSITLSLGVANIHDTEAIFDELLHAADLAMYQAKEQGRNQLVSYSTIVKTQERRKR